MIIRFKNMIKNSFGIIILLIPLFIFLFSCLYSIKTTETFISGLFTAKNNELNNPLRNNYTIKNEYSQKKSLNKDIHYKRHIPIDTNNFETNSTINAKKTNNLEPVGNNLFGNIQCRILSKCDNEFKETGAEFTGIRCQNDNTVRQAIAVASIKNGGLSEIHLIDGGLGYKNEPKIIIVGGNGRDAHCIPRLNNNGSIVNIEIKRNGVNYDSTPKVIIEEPHTEHKCKLCCK